MSDKRKVLKARWPPRRINMVRVELDAETYTVVYRAAERNGRSMSDEIRERLKRRNDVQEKRHTNYSQTVVDNLRRSHPNLAEFSDDQIDKAHRNWSVSEDHPDESLIVHWIDAPEYE